MNNEELALRHPGVRDIMRFFDWNHLPEHLQAVSSEFANLAFSMLEQNKEDSPELTAGLRKLLEAKDCFVRAALHKEK